MKKTTALITTAALAIILFGFSIGVTTAYFIDTASDRVPLISAGHLDIDIALTLGEFGIPSDELLTEEAVTVSTTSFTKTNIVYQLRLTLDKDTAFLLDDTMNGAELALRDLGSKAAMEPQKPSGLLVQGATKKDAVSGSVTYVFYGVFAHNPAGNEAAFDLALTFKGESLIDGNAFQQKPILIKPVAEACQANPSAVTASFPEISYVNDTISLISKGGGQG